MTAFVPLHRTAFERSSKLRRWLSHEVLAGLRFQFLKPEGWFDVGQGAGNYVWAPAPAAGENVVELLGKARLKRPEAMHVIVIPRLMTGRWRRHLGRLADCYCKLERVEGLWEQDQFEPLLIYFCLPYRSHLPRFGEQKQLLEGFERVVLRSNVWEVSPERGGRFLCQLCISVRGLCPV